MSKDATIPAGRVILAGLGNPGAKYELTRHNIGFDVVEAIEARFLASSQSKFQALMGSQVIGAHTVVTLRPQTFMNRSGQSVGEALRFWKLEPASTIVVHDDLDLPLGKIRIKLGGGHGGHNGLRSIDSHLGSKAYFRIRVGIGRPPHGNVTPWVLGRFAAEQLNLRDEVIALAVEAIERLLQEGLRDAQNAIHPQNLAPPPPASEG